jgi:hypothetical protein
LLPHRRAGKVGRDRRVIVDAGVDAAALARVLRLKVGLSVRPWQQLIDVAVWMTVGDPGEDVG